MDSRGIAVTKWKRICQNGGKVLASSNPQRSVKDVRGIISGQVASAMCFELTGCLQSLVMQLPTPNQAT